MRRTIGFITRTSSGRTYEDCNNRYLYKRFFTKGSHVRILMIHAMLPAMLHSVDMYNSVNFYSRATQLGGTFLLAFIYLLLLTWVVAGILARKEMEEDFEVKQTKRSEEQIETEYVKNELCIKPVPAEKDTMELNKPTPLEMAKSCKIWQQDNYYTLLFALTLSFVLTTPRVLVELVLHLHPRGDHPGKASWKLLATRTLSATWASEAHFFVDDQRGFQYMLPVLGYSKLILFVVQLFIWHLTTDNKLWWQMVPKVVNILYFAVWKWRNIIHYRKLLFDTAKRRWLVYLRKLDAKVSRRILDRDISVRDMINVYVPTSLSVAYGEATKEEKRQLQELFDGESWEQICERPEMNRQLNLLRQKEFEGQFCSGQGKFLEKFQGGPERPWGRQILEGRCPGAVRKTWWHVYRKHFEHTLGKSFDAASWQTRCSLHWPLPKLKNRTCEWCLFFVALLAPFVIAAFGCWEHYKIDLPSQHHNSTNGTNSTALKHFFAPEVFGGSLTTPELVMSKLI
eukprot:Skav200802  [mRNA]  locus=scaffold2549:179385:183254:- [translate_table: standard]